MTIRSVPASQTRPLRQALLRPGQPQEELRYPGDEAAHTLHAGAFAEGELVGIASVYSGRDGDQADAWRLRGMATQPAVRGQGYGTALLRACLGHVARLDGSHVWCNARSHAVGFYARHGFATRGEEFHLPGVGPHYRMERAVTRADGAGALRPDPEAEPLDTPRLRLRRWEGGDLDAFTAMCADAEVMRHTGEGRPLTRAEAETALQALEGHWQLHGFGLWAVVEQATDALVGRVGLWHPPGWCDVELAWLVDRSRWGRGYGTEAARAALAYGFDQQGLDRVVSLVPVGHAASERVAARLGMAPAEPTDWRGRTVRAWTLHRGEVSSVGRLPAD